MLIPLRPLYTIKFITVKKFAAGNKEIKIWLRGCRHARYRSRLPRYAL